MKYILNGTLLILILSSIGCDSDDVVGTEFETEIAEIRILPDSALLDVSEQMDFDLVALSESGDTVRDANLDVRWWSTDSTVFAVANDGMAIGLEPGSAYCMVEVNELAKVAPFTGRDSAFVTVFQF